MRKVRSSWGSISVSSCTELSKKPFFPVTQPKIIAKEVFYNEDFVDGQ